MLRVAKKKVRKKTKRKSEPTALNASPKFDERKFQIENAADTLMRAEKLRADKPLMREAKKELNKRAKAAVKAAKGG